MIGFNGTYLPVASLGNMRITAAAIGGQWVMKQWLKTATQQAIIAAFGAEEGIAVISKTNDYLNAIAATDTERAQQLAMFIQEDPMLVCSLVETSKERWIGTTAANQFFITDVKQSAANQLVEKAVVKYDKTGVRRLTGISGQGAEYWGVTAGNAYEKATVSQPDISKRTEITHKYTQTNSVIYLFAISNTGSFSNGGCYRSDTYLYLSDTLVKHYVPFKRNGEMEYLNLLDFTLATRVGTFTEIIEDKP